MTGKCSICVSKYKKWIEEQHENGKPLRDISKELEERFGESISYVAIGNHMNKHMGGDRTAVLEQRIRNLERWMSQVLPGSPFLIWVPKLRGAGDADNYNLIDRAAYLMTIPNGEVIDAEITAIKTGISAEMDKDEAERDKQKKERWAKERAARDESAKQLREEQETAQRKARDEARQIEIAKMREEVRAYDTRPKGLL